MGLFSKKVTALPAIVDPIEKMVSLTELNEVFDKMGDKGLQFLTNLAEKNFVDASALYSMYDQADSFGNFFGTEFDIRATAGRLKAMYTREPWVAVGATILARTLASIPLVVKDTKTKEINKGHPLNLKLAAANNLQSNMETKWCGYLDLVLGGNFFLAFDQSYQTAMQIPVELTQLRLDDKDRRNISGIQLWDNTISAYSKEIDYKNIVHFKLPNPYNPYYGLSLFTAAARPVLLDRFKNEFEMAFYLRGATNSGVIETTEDINKTRMERLMRTFEQAYTGKRNWWRTIFLPKGAKWIASGLTMAEMQHLEGLRENRLTLLAVLGIPPSQVGIVADVNRATAEVQERAFWNNTIVPLSWFVASGWNNSYLVKTIYGGQVCVEPDFSEIEALQGSLETKGTQAKSIENYFTINEIRDRIFKAPPDPRVGHLFVGEVLKQQQQDPLKALMDAMGGDKPKVDEFGDPIEDADVDEFGDPVEPKVDPATEELKVPAHLLSLKLQAEISQGRIERKLNNTFIAGYEKYMERVLELATEAVTRGIGVQKHLVSHFNELRELYILGVEEPLVSALARGFSFAVAQSKAGSSMQQRVKGMKPSQKRLRFSETDQQAIDALKAREESGQRTTLLKRAIDSFSGFSQTRTNEIVELITELTEGGQTFDQIAANLRSLYAERYQSQAHTIARTEILTAVSQGIKWNHEVLQQIFTEVQKQWFTVGDAGSNPNARDEHYGFELEGPQAADYRWGGALAYPRDPNASADQTINCRCTMVSVIPDDAISNAETILESI